MDAATLNKHLETRSYVAGEGFVPTSADVDQFKALAKAPEAKLIHATRWYRHISAFTDAERSAWAAGVTQAAPAAAAADDDDDDDSLFGSDDEEDAAAAAKIKADFEAKKAAAAQRLIDNEAKARSMIVFEVKPYEIETDLQALAKSIKAITHEGIQNWGQEHKLEPVAFGICKLVLSVIVFDKLCGMDEIEDAIMAQFEDDIQSIDVAAMSKV